jgi:transglutaminase-like putative cysteine protease
MSVLYDIEHVTTYSYRNPVSFGAHRAMFLPRTGGRGRILSYSATTSLPSRMRWLNDAFSNVVTLIEFSEPGAELAVTFRVRGIHYGLDEAETFPVEPRAQQVPVQYSPDDWIDLSHYLRPHTDDPDASVATWAKTFLASGQDATSDVLKRMLESIGSDFRYEAREAEGTRSPGETLHARSGTCRDYAWLMIEALRRLGFACRFVSGYLYDPALDGGGPSMTGSGATHAWVQTYLPGAGWANYDPTNRITAGYDLIPVAIARHPGQAAPLTGSWFGKAGDYAGMSVTVAIRKLATLTDDVPAP